jgi:hypothetical protein
MPTMSQLETQAQGALDQTNQTANPVEKFCMLWNTIINPALELVKAITGPKVDAQIVRIQTAVSSVCSGESGGVQKFCAIWPTLKPLLRALEIFTPPKVDKAIDQFIAIADGLCPA